MDLCTAKEKALAAAPENIEAGASTSTASISLSNMLSGAGKSSVRPRQSFENASDRVSVGLGLVYSGAGGPQRLLAWVQPPLFGAGFITFPIRRITDHIIRQQHHFLSPHLGLFVLRFPRRDQRFWRAFRCT